MAAVSSSCAVAFPLGKNTGAKYKAKGKPSGNPIIGQAVFFVKKWYRLLKLCGDVFSFSVMIALGDRYFCHVIPHR
jgi:hypothetical protein